MSRSRSRVTVPNFSLFPFLAVLLCTMGALIVLLFALVQNGRTEAKERVEALSQELQGELEFCEWKGDSLRQIQHSMEAELQAANGQLAAMDAAAAEAEQQLQDLEQRAQQFVEVARQPASEEQALRQAIAAAQAELATLESEPVPTAPVQKVQQYAVVPYLGKQTTFRPPVYIECRKDTVVIRPQNIVLTAEDFSGTLGPENPLASILRATRTYLKSAPASADGVNNSLKEPYPLILVRPDGIGAFYVAREAVKSFSTQFGYELVEADWELKFPAPDAGLAQVQLAALADARERNRILVQAAPKLYGGEDAGSVFLTATGQAASNEQPGQGTSSTPGSSQGTSVASADGVSSALAENRQNEQAWQGFAANVVGENGPITQDQAKDSAPGLGNPIPTETLGTGSLASGDPTAFANSTGPPPGGEDLLASGEGDPALAGEAGSPGEGTQSESGGPATASAGQPEGSTEFDSSGNRTSETAKLTASEPNWADAGEGDGALAKGSSQGRGSFSHKSDTTPQGDNPQGAAGQTADASVAQGAQGQPTAGQTTAAGAGPSLPFASGPPGADSSTTAERAEGEPMPSVEMSQRPADSAPSEQAQAAKKQVSPLDEKCMARKLGRNWALPQAARAAVPVTRPVFVRCAGNELNFLDERGRLLASVPWDPQAENPGQTVVDQTWDLAQGWGSAGSGMHWRPALKVEVMPGGERTFRELQATLSESGVEVERASSLPFFARRKNPVRQR